MFALLIVACVRFASMRRQSTRCVFDRSNEFNCAVILRWCLHIVFVFATLPPPPWLIKMCFMLSVRTQVMTITSTRSSGESPSISSGVWATSRHPLPSIFDFFVCAEVFQMQHSYCMVSSIETKYWLCCWHVKFSIWCVIGSLREWRPRATTSIHYPSLLVNTNFTFLSHLYRCDKDDCHKLVWPKGLLLLYWSHPHIYSTQSIDCGTPLARFYTLDDIQVVFSCTGLTIQPWVFAPCP